MVQICYEGYGVEGCIFEGEVGHVLDYVFLREAGVLKDVDAFPISAKPLSNKLIVIPTPHVEAAPNDFSRDIVEPFGCKRGQAPPVLMKQG